MAYTKTEWINDSVPAINASNLNKIEQGIYDNAFESGSNANGSYIKFNDGTMICYGSKDINNVSFTQFTTSINYSNIQTITFPQLFINNPSTSIGCRSSNMAWSSNVISSTSNFTFYILQSTDVTRTIHCEWQAIGRWK